MDNGKPDEMDISAVDLGMPQRKKRRIDESDDHDTSRLSVENQHPIFLVSIHCPPADCSFWATDPGIDIFILKWVFKYGKFRSFSVQASGRNLEGATLQN